MFKGQEELELTEGGIAKPLFFLSLPIVVTNLLQTAYNLADTFWLGQYSTEALAAISFAFPMVFLLISLGLGLSVAGSVLVAQNTGAGDERAAEYAASQTVTFSFVAAIVLGIAGYFFVDDLLAFFGASPGVLDAATSYMQIVSLGLPLMFGFFIFISLMRGYGDTITPMLVMLGTVVVNIALDPFLIFGWGVGPLTLPFVGWTVGPVVFPELGITGAAYATVFSRGLAMVVGMAIMLSGTRGVKIRLADMRPDPVYLRKILRIGVPASIEGTGRALSVNLLLIVVGMFPKVVVAGFGIGIRVFSVIFLPAIAVARGVETMAGQNIGADQPDRAEASADFAAKAMFLVLGAAGVLIFLVPEPIVSVFTPDQAVVDVGAEFLRYVALTFGFIGVMRAYTGAFRGAGKTLVAAAIAITFLGFIRLPIAWLLSQGIGGAVTLFGYTVQVPQLLAPMGPPGIWWGFVVSNVAGAVIALAWYKRGTWRDADVRGGPGPAPGPEADDVEAAATDDD
ncbi:MATE family efflux transporter [Halorarius halobius]|uniref:MATE family efflux transporter n=1 Tax=Halorarius halobius TaxID=2962671 RepID=UPI0020CE61DB|nr:MATE family efflux transporter [Halorarius halobius]